jgi:subtilisin family serine protease
MRRSLRGMVVVMVAALMLAGCSTPVGRVVVASPDLHAGTLAGQEDRVIVIAVANSVAELPRLAGSTSALYARQSRYVAGSGAQALLAEVARDHRLVPLAEWPIDVLHLHCATLLVPEGVSRDEVLAALRRDPRIELAQPLHQFDTLTAAAPTYDDPYLPLQRGLQQLGVLEAHRCTRGRGTRIAVIDTGIDTAHPDLRGASATTANFVDRDDGRFQRDTHGTEVAGVIAAQPGNARGIVGIAPDARLLALKACWERGDGRAACNSFTLAQALAAAIDRGAQVINLSLGGPPDELLTRMVQAAQARGAVVVGAMPPGAVRNGFPVTIAGVIVAGDGGGAFAAPARDVLTLTPGGRYDFASGSSIAAAQVTAIVALLLERRPGLDAASLERVLRTSGAAGAPHACRALAAVDTGCRCGPSD